MKVVFKCLASCAFMIFLLSSTASAQSNEIPGSVKINIATDKYPVKIEQVGDSLRITRIYEQPGKTSAALSFVYVGAGQLFNVIATKRAIDRGAHEINPIAGNPRRIAILSASAITASAILYKYKPSWRKVIVRFNFAVGTIATAGGTVSSFASR